MHYIVESSKSFYEATFDLVPTIQRLGFVVLATHDLGGLLQRKDIDLDDDCQIVEICNYRYVEKLLAIDMRFSVSLPWRISVFTENGATKIGVSRLDSWLAISGDNPELARLIAEIESKLVMIVDDAR
ncbi:MAG TPA: DUF302 domain-containing protein [Azonexus sp.]|nr:DUF302 domain-containing protein [Azonexus sp.]